MTTVDWPSSVARGADRRLIALLALLAIGILIGMLLAWWVGSALIAVGLFLATWPLEPFPALLGQMRHALAAIPGPRRS